MFNRIQYIHRVYVSGEITRGESLKGDERTLIVRIPVHVNQQALLTLSLCQSDMSLVSLHCIDDVDSITTKWCSVTEHNSPSIFTKLI